MIVDLPLGVWMISRDRGQILRVHSASSDGSIEIEDEWGIKRDVNGMILEGEVKAGGWHVSAHRWDVLVDPDVLREEQAMRSRGDVGPTYQAAPTELRRLASRRVEETKRL